MGWLPVSAAYAIGVEGVRADEWTGRPMLGRPVVSLTLLEDESDQQDDQDDQ